MQHITLSLFEQSLSLRRTRDWLNYGCLSCLRRFVAVSLSMGLLVLGGFWMLGIEVLQRRNFDNNQHPTGIHFQSAVPDVQRHWSGAQFGILHGSGPCDAIWWLQSPQEPVDMKPSTDWNTIVTIGFPWFSMVFSSPKNGWLWGHSREVVGWWRSRRTTGS